VNLHSIATIARQELIISIRNRWTLIFAAVFAVLVLALSYFGLVTAGAVGFQGFVRTAASLLNLVLYLVPLVALTMGTLSFTSEKSSSEILFSQPVSRGDILMGKLAGLFASLAAATLLGFGAAGLVIAAGARSSGAVRYPGFVGLSLALGLVFLVLSAVVATACHRRNVAFGVSLFVWFFFVLLYDLLVMGATFMLRERTANTFLFVSLLGNPVDIVRVGCLMILDGKEVFGATGAALLRFLGGDAAAFCVLAVALLAWIAVPLIVARKALDAQDI